ncbi:spermidine/putrescine ABC transporter substrate-binding protein [Streptomyces sp. FIT100]|uniref:polyamine ABC transporter substrate-binding protein n=1 Tax=Streptomyces sp. FIT100 TaxID=2837956 RepID=UPI0021C602F1|nr:spermidine/putrescine ABC transporter substrate-binding protein [Streptomyces sp. FIT100]UUN30915.1 spermidine/putrescine ABC transporter substrate-binding protein [Streptomyces sp. FIT100]
MSTVTRRALLRAGTAGSLAAAGAGCAFLPHRAPAGAGAERPVIRPEPDGDLHYFNWADYIDPALLKGFAKEYGVEVLEANFDSMEAMIAKITAGNRYDVVFPTARWVQRLAAAGELHPLPLERFTGWGHIYEEFHDPWYDPGSAHSVPYQMYMTGIGWRKDKLGELSGSWNDLWHEGAGGRTYLLDDRDEVLGAVALLLGFDLNETDPVRLERVCAKARTLRPRLRGFSSDDHTNMLNGNAWLHQMWSGDFLVAVRASGDAGRFGFQTCREGVPVNSDCFAIPRGARHPGTALLFIDYMLRPDNAVRNLRYIGYPQPHRATEGAFREISAGFPQLRISPAELAFGHQYRNLPLAQTRLRDAVWTTVKAA